MDTSSTLAAILIPAAHMTNIERQVQRPAWLSNAGRPNAKQSLNIIYGEKQAKCLNPGQIGLRSNIYPSKGWSLVNRLLTD